MVVFAVGFSLAHKVISQYDLKFIGKGKASKEKKTNCFYCHIDLSATQQHIYKNKM